MVARLLSSELEAGEVDVAAGGGVGVAGAGLGLLAVPFGVECADRNDANVLVALDAPSVVVGAVEPNADANGVAEVAVVLGAFVVEEVNVKGLVVVAEELPNPANPANFDTGVASFRRHVNPSYKQR